MRGLNSNLNSQQKMSIGTEKPINGSGSESASGRFKAKIHHYLYSGEKKHVFGGIVIIGVLCGVPWYLMTRGAKHQSHQDYLEKADKARSERLSAGSSTIR